MMMNESLHYPCTYKTTLQSIQQVNNDRVQQQQIIQPQYFLPAAKIVAWARKINHPTNPVKSFSDRDRMCKMKKKPYFDVNAEQLQEVVNRLNIQQRLSKQQLNEQKLNGYRKIKVKIHLFLYVYVTQQIYINKFLFVI